MFANKTLAKLFTKKPQLNQDNSCQWHLVVELSFEANAQVSYKDENACLRIKRFQANRWETDFRKASNINSPIEFKVFVYTPNLDKDEQVKLSISMEGQLVEQQTFSISMDNDYAGWFTLSYQPEI